MQLCPSSRAPQTRSPDVPARWSLFVPSGPVGQAARTRPHRRRAAQQRATSVRMRCVAARHCRVPGGLLRKAGALRSRVDGEPRCRTYLQLGNGVRVVAGARVHYQSEILTGLDFTPLQYQDSYVSVGASITYNSNDNKYYVTAYGNNLTDETVVANSFQPPFGSFVVGNLRPPRLYGLRLGARF